jgi:hypothetical protein
VLRVFFKEINEMKKYVLLVAAILFGMVAPVLAAEGDLHGNVGVTYDSLYVFRGFLSYGSQSGIHPFIDLDLFGSGFHFETIGNRANDSGYETAERWDYSLYYVGAINPEETSAMMYKVGYRYFNYPDMSSHTRASIDLQELYAGVAFQKLLGVKGLVPGYVIVKGWPSNSDTVVGGSNPCEGTYSGFAHVFMLDYALPLENVSSEIPKQDLNFHVETVYNDGIDPRPLGGYTDSDWTHVLFGVSTDFDLGNNFIFTPGLWHQVTFEDNGNELIAGQPTSTRGVSPDHDMTWASLTVKYKF